MKTIERSILVFAVLVILVLFLYPPFMVVDPRSGGRVHGTLGHYAVWNAPTPASAFHVLYPNVQDVPNAEVLAGLMPRINRVRLSIYAFAVALAGSFSLILIRKLRVTATSRSRIWSAWSGSSVIL